MLDIKLKNNHKKSFCMALVAVLVFALVFMSLYPVFGRRAAKYYTDVLEEDEFLTMINQSNYILYKDLIQKVQQTNLSYTDLYLEVEEKTVPADDVAGAEQVEDALLYAENLKENIEGMLINWENTVTFGIAQQLDYLAVDHDTGQVIKNTGRNIEALNVSGTSAQKEETPYVYYIRISYDSAGNVEKVAVRSGDSDNLLKKVQQTMKSSILKYFGNYTNQSSFYDMDVAASYYDHGDEDSLAIIETEELAHKVTYTTKAPENCTFIYALTEQQKASLINAGGVGYSQNNFRWEEENAYYLAGVGDIYRVMLLILAVSAFIIMRLKKDRRKKSGIAELPMEVSGFLMLLLAFGFDSSIIGLVNYTNRGYFDAVFGKYVQFLPARLYPALTGMINVGFLCLIFGVWLYCVYTLREVFELGIKGFVMQRSIAIRVWKDASGFIGSRLNSLKEELLHADLGEKAGKTIRRAVILNFIILAVMCSMWFFGWAALAVYSVLLYYCLNKYVRRIQDQYRKLLSVTGSIAEGNLNTAFDEDLGVFESYKEELDRIQEGFRSAVDEEVKSQRMKTELITNVSHDLKTPLTAITTYIDLLKEDITEEQRKEYIAVLEKKSLRLKLLIEDLFEVSKANSKNVTINRVDVDLCNLMRQVYLELEDKAQEADLMFRFHMPEDKAVLQLDSQKTYRIFENLYINIIKYAMPHTRVYVDAEKTDNGIRIEMKNMSAVELNIPPEELTERFVRGDSSRNTEGSGLGLAIARSFTELQGGKMQVGIDGDLFKVTLEW